MRLRSNVVNGYSSQAMDSMGGVLTLPLMLVSSNPIDPLEAASKQYVDSKIDNIAGGDITGIFLPARMPPLSGTDVSSSGGGVLTLSDTGVAEGVYTKVQVDAKGRVLSGATLTAADLPNFSWNKITTDKPTTLAGYGITDALSLSGGAFTGPLLLTTTPTLLNHAANKAYVDARVGAVAGSGDFLYKAGDMIEKSFAGSVTGVLRANGSKVSKATYAALYTEIGDKYFVPNLDGASAPWKNQYALNLPGVLSAGATAYNHPFAGFTTNAYFMFATKNKAYFGSSTNLFTIDINSDGTLGATAILNNALSGLSAIGVDGAVCFVTGNKVWVANLALSNESLWYATINADGTIGVFTQHRTASWVTQKTKAIRVKNRMYFIDTGFSSNPGGIGYGYATIDAEEKIGPYNHLGAITGSTSLIGAIDVVVIKNKLVVIASSQNNASSHMITPYYAAINSDGTLGAWSLGPTFSYLLSSTSAYAPRPDLGCLMNTTDGIYLIYNGQKSTAIEGTFDPVHNLVRQQLGVDGAGTPVSWGESEELDIHTNSYTAGRKLTPLFTSSKMYLPMSAAGDQDFKVRYFNYANGINDYSPYYDGTIYGIDLTKFFLPNLTSEERPGKYWYIKT